MATKAVAERNPAVDAYIAKAAPFAQPVLQALRELVHAGAPGVVEAMKWSRPFFVYEGVILGNISAFKEHCSFGLWGKEATEALRMDGVGGGVGMGSFGKITSMEDLPSRAQLVGYVKAAAKAIASGERTVAWERPRVARPEPTVPAALAAGLHGDAVAAKAFAAMTAGCRREYCEWIDGAKREDTKQKRVASALAWIAAGKSLNWRYEKG
jgi:uncharacterized protein YdeI (YjbR/CyaY-like superfamily)